MRSRQNAEYAAWSCVSAKADIIFITLTHSEILFFNMLFNVGSMFSKWLLHHINICVILDVSIGHISKIRMEKQIKKLLKDKAITDCVSKLNIINTYTYA